MESILPGLLMFATSVAIYLVPSIVAYDRRHHNCLAIFVLNVLIGWTILGWVGALVWACTVVRAPLPPANGTPSASEPLPMRWGYRATQRETTGI